jgi:hypothetical protein
MPTKASELCSRRQKATPAGAAGVEMVGASESRSTIGLARRYAIDIRSRDPDIGELAVT